MCHFGALCAGMEVLKWLEGYHPLTSRESAVTAAVTHDSTPTLNPTLVLSSAAPQQLFETMCECEGVWLVCVHSPVMLKRKLENESLCVCECLCVYILGCRRSPVSLLSGVGVRKQWAHCVESWHRGEGGR